MSEMTLGAGRALNFTSRKMLAERSINFTSRNMLAEKVINLTSFKMLTLGILPEA